MWAGQFFGELLNWIIKHAIKEERPIRESSIIEFLHVLTTELECIFGFQNGLVMDMVFHRLIANIWPTSARSSYAICI